MEKEIHNAGLVLINPFLLSFFQHLKLTGNNKWIDKTSQHKAVLILEFLTSGNEEFMGLNLMLNKILCGIPIDEIVATDKQLDNETKKECEVLINTVITNWSTLRNTNISGLHEAFLQRNGKISKVDNGWLLQVEQKPFDILLSSIPWEIGTIKLPWMKEMIHVEWE